MMLSLDTAYRSFGGEVEASSTPTICRLPDSRRHQLSAIALARRQQSSSGTDAAGQGELDFAAGQLSMARNSSPRCSCGRRATEGQSDQLAERLLPEEPSPTYF